MTVETDEAGWRWKMSWKRKRHFECVHTSVSWVCRGGQGNKSEQREVMRFGWSAAVINTMLGSNTGHTFGQVGWENTITCYQIFFSFLFSEPSFFFKLLSLFFSFPQPLFDFLFSFRLLFFQCVQACVSGMPRNVWIFFFFSYNFACFIYSILSLMFFLNIF